MGQSQTTLNVINDNTLAASLSVKGKAATVELESYCERYGVAERSLFNTFVRFGFSLTILPSGYLNAPFVCRDIRLEDAASGRVDVEVTFTDTTMVTFSVHLDSQPHRVRLQGTYVLFDGTARGQLCTGPTWKFATPATSVLSPPPVGRHSSLTTAHSGGDAHSQPPTFTFQPKPDMYADPNDTPVQLTQEFAALLDGAVGAAAIADTGSRFSSRMGKGGLSQPQPLVPALSRDRERELFGYTFQVENEVLTR